MRYRGADIFTVRVPRSGVSYGGELEFRLAAVWAHYRWEQFCELDGEEQSATVAAYRASNQIEAVLANEANKKNARPGK